MKVDEFVACEIIVEELERIRFEAEVTRKYDWEPSLNFIQSTISHDNNYLVAALTKIK